MHLIQNRAIALFVAFTLVCASLWATSPDATADAIKADTPGYILSVHHHDGDNVKYGDQSNPSQHCNHGCHVAMHLLGFAADTTSHGMAPEHARLAFSFSDQLISNPYLQGPFRPPLAASIV